MTQLELHKKIREILQKSPQDVKKDEVFNLISVNFDAKNYFFAKADEKWLDWLWDNGFLTDAITKKAEDPTRYGYRTPELRYLVKMAENKPAKVAEIISSGGTATIEDNFNPEVVDQFLRICSKLPPKELAIVVPKIKEENWVRLMGVFNQWGFGYEKMFKRLDSVKDYKNILGLAEVVLSVRSEEEIKKSNDSINSDNPFYFDDLSYIKVFDYLIKIDNEHYVKKTFSLLTKKLGEIIKLTGEKGKDEVFDFYDRLLILYDVNDISELRLSQSKISISERESIENLIAVIVALGRQLIEKNCDKKEFVKDIYEKNIRVLPDSRPIWRLKLFILSLCPEMFKKELKDAIFRLFKVGSYYYEILSEEYRNALQKVFPLLGENDGQEYIKKVIRYFTRKDQEKGSEKGGWHLRYGSWILSAIYNQLTEKERELITKVGFELKPNYKIRPDIVSKFGAVIPKGPITQEGFHNKPVGEIVKLLKTKWAPENLRKKNKGDDFLRPLNAEGTGKLLRNDIPTRFQEYINKAVLFFKREELDPHYTYSFLLGVWEYMHNNREKTTSINWNGLVNLLLGIKESAKKPLINEKRERKTFDVWLSDWTAVHSAMADVVQELLREQNGQTLIDFSKYRRQLFGIIKYLLNYPDPKPEDERGKSAKISQRTDSGEYIASDPFTIAINSVRGRAFQTFVLFVYQDGKELEKEKIKIRNEVKKVYEEVLEKENTRAIMFMFGHYLPSFYFRDEKWTKGLLSKIFPEEPEKKNLYTAAWEGYLSANLYKQMFFDSDIQRLYERALNLTDEDYPEQKHFKDPGEALADHLALAFVHFPEFDFKHSLFNKFWKDRNTKRHKEFISFIGRHAISREAPNEWIKQNKINRNKLKEFWDWALEKNLEPDVLAGFGFWINPNEEVLGNEFVIKKIAQTIEKSEGKIDWDYGLLKRLPVFAEVDPENTLKIIKNYLLNEDNNLNQNRRALLIGEREIKSALEIIYKNGNKKAKQETTYLVNTLIEKGSSMFWELEDIMQEK